MTRDRIMLHCITARFCVLIVSASRTHRCSAVLFVHSNRPSLRIWGNGRDFVTEAEAHLIAGYTTELDEEQLCDTKTRIESVQKWTSETGGQRGEGH